MRTFLKSKSVYSENLVDQGWSLQYLHSEMFLPNGPLDLV
jgi:hypothetical protein